MDLMLTENKEIILSSVNDDGEIKGFDNVNDEYPLDLISINGEYKSYF